jgi:hypothetical protein
MLLDALMKLKEQDPSISFRRSCRPPARLSPSAWSSGRIAIQDGLTPKFQIENAPWQREPLDILAESDASQGRTHSTDARTGPANGAEGRMVPIAIVSCFRASATPARS